MLAQWHFWTAFFGTGALLVLLAWLGSRRRKLSPKQIAAGGYPAACGSCGYNLTGLPGNICPECGSDLELVGRLSPRFYRWSAVPITARLIVWTVCVGVIAAGLVYFALENHLPRKQDFQATTAWLLQERLEGLGAREWDTLPVMNLSVTAWLTRRNWPSEAAFTSYSHQFPDAATRWTGAVVQSQAFSYDSRTDQDGNPYWNTKFLQSGLVYLTRDQKLPAKMTAGAAEEFGPPVATAPSLPLDAEAAVLLALTQAGYDGSHGPAEEIAPIVAAEIERFLHYGAVSPQTDIAPWRATPTYGGPAGAAGAEPMAVLVVGGFWFAAWLAGLPFILRKRPMSIRRDALGTQSLLAGSLLLAPLLAGCITVKPPPPGGPVKATLPRPVVVIGGIYDPGRSATGPARYVREQTGDERILAVHPGFAWSFDGAADTVIDAVEHHFPSDDPDQTIEVDVIGVSMGGLVARHAAAPGQNGAAKRLNIRRLYTVAAPHSGAVMADMFGLIGTPQEMRSGGPFLRHLAQREQATTEDDYDVVAYSRGRDQVIGEGIRLPPHLAGTEVHFSPAWYAPGHFGVHRDKRILADIVARLQQSEGAGTTPLRAASELRSPAPHR